MARVIIITVFAAILGMGWYMSVLGVAGESTDLQSVRTGSAGAPYYGVRSIK